MSTVESSSTVSSLGKRLAAVGLLYRTRPLMWVMLAVYLLAVAGVWHNLSDPRPPFEAMMDGVDEQRAHAVRGERQTWEVQRRRAVTPRRHSPAPKLYFAAPEMRQIFERNKPVLPEDAKSIEVFDVEHIPAEFWKPGHYPRVETVEFHSKLDGGTLRKLMQMYPLKNLVINVTEKVTAEDWQALGQSETLEELSFHYAPLVEQSGSLLWPKNLRLLAFTAYRPLPLQRLEEWRALPRLTTLSLGMPADVQPSLFTPEMISAWERLASRTTLYLDLPESSDGESAFAAQPHFHKLTVRPQFVAKARMAAGMYVYFLLLIPTAFGIYQLSSQSLQPLMLLAPGTKSPHQLLAAGWWCLGSVVSAGFAISNGISAPAALALSVSGVLWYQLQRWLLHRGEGVNQVGFAHPIFAAFPVMFVGVVFGLGTALVQFYPTIGGEIDWFLRGQRPYIAMGIFIAGIAAGGNLLSRQVLLQRAAQEVGIGQVPLSALDLGGWNRAVTLQSGKRIDNAVRWNPIMRARERRIDAALDRGPALTRGRRISVWMCGVHAHPLDITVVVAKIGLLQSVLLWLIRNHQGMEANLQRVILLSPALQIVIMLSMFPIGVLWIRRRWMPQELLFPLSRKDWTRDWFAIQACLLLPIPCVLVLFVILDTLMGGVVRPTPAEFALGFVGMVAVMITSWALSLITVTLRTTSIAKLAFMVLGVFGAMTSLALLSIVWPVVDEWFDAILTAPAIPAIAALALVVSLVALILWARHRWAVWEVGRQA